MYVVIIWITEMKNMEISGILKAKFSQSKLTKIENFIIEMQKMKHTIIHMKRVSFTDMISIWISL